MSKHVASLVFARSLSLLGLLILLPLFLSASTWFLSKTGISFFITTENSLVHLTSSSRALWILYNIGGPIIAVMLLALSLTLEQEQGAGAFSRAWKRFILIAVGICLIPLALGLCIHALLGT